MRLSTVKNGDEVKLVYEDDDGEQVVEGEVRYAPLPEWTTVRTPEADYKIYAGLGNSTQGEVSRTPHETANDPSVENFGTKIVGKFKRMEP